MHRYSTYGLIVDSDEPISGLTVANGSTPADVSVRFHADPPWTHEAALGERYRAASRAGDAVSERLVVTEHASGFSYRYGDGAAFDIARDGREVWCRFVAPNTLADAAVYLLGPVLGFVLRLKGVLCLHASAVLVDGGAIALVGGAGAGKSTTAAAFAAAGFPVLADDLVALAHIRGEWIAHPAYDHLRLWPESERILLGTQGRLPPLTPNWEKLEFSLDVDGRSFHDRPAPLRAIVFLGERGGQVDAPVVTPAKGPDSLLRVIGDTYASYMLDGRMRAQELGDVSALVAAVPCFRGTPHEDPRQLDALVTAIVKAVRGAR